MRTQTQLNASALPLLGFGVVLTAAANPLSGLALFNVVLVALVLGLSLRVLVPIVVRWLRERKSRRTEGDGYLLGANGR